MGVAAVEVRREAAGVSPAEGRTLSLALRLKKTANRNSVNSEGRSGQRSRNLTVERNEPNANCEESCNFQEPFVLFLSVCTPSMVVGVVAGVVVS